MSWDVVSQHIDKQLGHHIIHLQDAWSKSRHIIQIMIGKDHCPLCGHVHPKTNTGELDVRAIIARNVEALETVHANIDAHAKKWGVAVRQPK
jgi:hypothetical protein